jgi:hypothetical protein
MVKNKEVITSSELGYLQHFTGRGDVENIVTVAIENLILYCKDNYGKEHDFLSLRYEQIVEVLLQGQESDISKDVIERILTFLVCKEYLRLYDRTNTKGYCLLFPDILKLNWARTLTRLPSDGWIPIGDYLRDRKTTLYKIKFLIGQLHLETVKIYAVRYVRELNPDEIEKFFVSEDIRPHS